MSGSRPLRPLRALLVDNHDSYTHVLAHLLTEALGVEPLVLTHEDERIRQAVGEVDALVISPGPGHPARAEDVRLSRWALEHSGLPTLGVCLGHQLMAVATGGRVVRAPRAEHGLVDRIEHSGTGLLADVPGRTAEVVRYHSLCVAEPLPGGWVVDARSPDGVVQAMHHTGRPWWGVQFHPESVSTAVGLEVVRAFAAAVRGSREGLAAEPPPLRAGAGDADPVHPGGPTWQVVAERLPAAGCPSGAQVHAWAAKGTPEGEGDGDAGDGATGAGRSARAASWWLDTARPGVAEGRFSFIGVPGGPWAHTLVPDDRTNPFDALEKALGARRTAPRDDLPFDLQGGYVGWFGYEARRWLDPRQDAPPVPRAETPDAVWTAADRYVVLDHLEGGGWVVAHCPDDEQELFRARAWARHTVAELTGAAAHVPEPRAAAAPLVGDPEGALVCSREEYERRVGACRELLLAGESYELCLTTRAAAVLAPGADAVAAYLRQRVTNPAPYAALLRWGPWSVLSSSPERFLRVRHDRSVETRPIKGTAPRLDDPAADAVAARQLAADPKTRAENLMVVDLLRNDLARVCRPGSVRVPDLMRVESHATVHQLVSTVTGSLRPGTTAVDLLRATFPGGSMTGAPKLRSMDLLAELEDGPRGVYSGTLGYLSATGAADLAVVIRTAVVGQGRASVGAGGAIVLDSQPEHEYREMVTKATSACR